MMTTPMDRGFGDDPFRRMERKKMSKEAGLQFDEVWHPDIEDPIIPNSQYE